MPTPQSTMPDAMFTQPNILGMAVRKRREVAPAISRYAGSALASVFLFLSLLLFTQHLY